MADYHVLDISSNRVRVAMHFVVPNGTNSAGKSWKDCLLEDPAESNATILDDNLIDLTEKTDIENANKIERVVNIQFHKNHPTSQTKTLIENKYTNLKNELSETLSAKYEFWGFNDNIT